MPGCGWSASGFGSDIEVTPIRHTAAITDRDVGLGAGDDREGQERERHEGDQDRTWSTRSTAITASRRAGRAERTDLRDLRLVAWAWNRRVVGSERIDGPTGEMSTPIPTAASAVRRLLQREQSDNQQPGRDSRIRAPTVTRDWSAVAPVHPVPHQHVAETEVGPQRAAEEAVLSSRMRPTRARTSPAPRQP